jgi:serine/threonine-protein kinase/endoribonuclease IRE1
MNILLADKRKSVNRQSEENEETILSHFDAGNYIAKISDVRGFCLWSSLDSESLSHSLCLCLQMGLGKQLVGQSSYGASFLGDGSLRGSTNGAQSSIVGGGAGSVGWQAPEVMAMRTVPADASVRSEASSGIESSLLNESAPDVSPLDVAVNSRTSRSVDIFSLGCIFYSTLLPGCHPFGEWYEREANIMHYRPTIDALDRISPDALDLVSSMLQRRQHDRPSATQVCSHPFFWSLERRLSFLCDFSDRIESESVHPEGVKCSGLSPLALAVERNASKVVGLAWDSQLDEELVGNVQRFRTYDPSSVRDLLRLIRNKHHHFDELPEDLKKTMASSTDGLARYFESRFPRLLIHCFNVCRAFLSLDDLLSQKYNILPVRQLKESTVKRPETSAYAMAESNLTPLDPGVPVAECSQKLVTPTGSASVDAQGCLSESQPANAILAPISVISTGDDIGNEPCEVQVVLPTTAGSSPERIAQHGQDTPYVASDDLVIWEGSTAARTFHCRGWSRSDDEWERRMDARLLIHRNKRDDSLLLRCAEDPKFRTRLCNYWDESLGTSCPMRKRGKCIFAHGPVELRVKEAKRHRWGKLVDKNGDNNNPCHSGGEDTYGVARSIETERKHEGKWGPNKPCVQHPKGKKPGKKGRPT